MLFDFSDSTFNLVRFPISSGRETMQFMSMLSSVREVRFPISGGIDAMLFVERSSFSKLTNIDVYIDLGTDCNELSSIFSCFSEGGSLGKGSSGGGGLPFLFVETVMPSLFPPADRICNLLQFVTNSNEPDDNLFPSQLNDFNSANVPIRESTLVRLLFDTSKVLKFLILANESMV